LEEVRGGRLAGWIVRREEEEYVVGRDGEVYYYFSEGVFVGTRDVPVESFILSAV
jgi:hypothetical protein